MSGTRNATELIRARVEAAIERHAPDEGVVWDTSLIQVPAANTMAVVVSVWMRSPILGGVLNVASGVVDVLGLAADDGQAVEDLVRGQVEQLRALRTKTLDEALPQQNGSPSHGPG